MRQKEQRHRHTDAMKQQIITEYRAGRITEDEMMKRYRANRYDITRFEKQLQKKMKRLNMPMPVIEVNRRADPKVLRDSMSGFAKDKDEKIQELQVVIAELTLVARRLQSRLSRYEPVHKINEEFGVL